MEKLALDRQIQELPPHQRCHLGIARTLQTPKLFVSLKVRENVAISTYFGNPGKNHTSKKVDDALKYVGLGQSAETTVANLNLIGQKLTMIACALATQPKLLLLDEPMAGLNQKEIEQTTRLIKKINREKRMTIIIIEHFMKVLTELSSRLMILDSGKLVCSDSPENVVKDKRVIECYLGE